MGYKGKFRACIATKTRFSYIFKTTSSHIQTSFGINLRTTRVVLTYVNLINEGGV